MQGNGAAPAGWTVVSIVILRAHQAHGHGASFHCPISGVSNDISCILYVDDNDLLHLGHGELHTATNAHEAIQASVNTWSNLLIATGGALKPAKCSYYVISYEWDNKGNWRYAQNQNRQDFSISVTLPDGTTSTLEHLAPDTPSITLGGSTCPSGKASGMMSSIIAKAHDWASLARSSGLKPRDFHISVHKKFWPKIKYGLCANPTPFDELVRAMHKPYYWMAPLGGLIRSA